MLSDHSTDVKFEIGHVLFIDVVGYSKLLIKEQSEQLEKAYHERSDSLACFRNELESKGLQSDPRFAGLMRKIGFTKR